MAQDLYQICQVRTALVTFVCLFVYIQWLHAVKMAHPAPFLRRNTGKGYPLSSDGSLAGPITELGFSQLTTYGPITGQYS